MLADARPLDLLQPGRISFGAGVALSCLDELARRGCRRTCFVLSRSAAIHAQPILAAARARDIAVTTIDGIAPEPAIADFERVRTAARAFRPDAIVALGGGSVLDVAKLVAALHDRTEDVRACFGTGLVPARPTTLICLPTTAGTGSEVSPNALLYDETAGEKRAVIGPPLVPDAAFIDPLLTVSMPPAVTAATGLDALTHCIEGYANRAAHPIVDLYALQGVRLIAAHLPRAVHDGADRAARAAVALGSLYGGLCLGPVNTAAVHALSYPLGSTFRLAHGLSNALLLPHVIRFNLSAAPARYAAIARALGCEAAPGDDDLALAQRGADRLAQLSRACNLPAGLAAVGVPRDAVPAMAEAALRVTRLLRNNPREVTRADAEQIYRDAF